MYCTHKSIKNFLHPQINKMSVSVQGKIAITGPKSSGKQWIHRAIKHIYPDHVIRTKYFTAQFELEIVQDFLQSLDYHAIILVVDATKPFSLENMQKYQNLKAEVLICVANKVQECPEELQDWCLDHGFEAIYWKLNDLGKVGTQRGLLSNNEEEECGLERIVQALENSAWVRMDSEIEIPSVEVEQGEVDSEIEDERRVNAMLEQMDVMLAKAKSVREMGASISDEERRKLASDTAMEMWKLMFGEEDLHSDEE
jgi:hypothetical protein